ncbi:MAG: HAD-IB family phosphatase [Gemmatimonadaceae bacterium]
MTRFRTVILDVDSTLSGIEGIDWLAVRHGPDVVERVSRLTELAMSGASRLDDVFELRLSEVRPSRGDVGRLADAYISSVARGAAESIVAMQAAGVQVVLVSGGIREAILPLAELLGVAADDVHAVSVSFTSSGGYGGYDEASLLSRQGGKRLVVDALDLPRPVIAVGDGVTDAELRPAVDCFVAFTGFVTRMAVVRAADATVATFRQLQELVLG